MFPLKKITANAKHSRPLRTSEPNPVALHGLLAGHRHDSHGPPGQGLLLEGTVGLFRLVCHHVGDYPIRRELVVDLPVPLNLRRQRCGACEDKDSSDTLKCTTGTWAWIPSTNGDCHVHTHK